MPKMKYWDGSNWIELDAKNADTLGGQPASYYMPKSGGTMEGTLTVPGSVYITGGGNIHLWYRHPDGTNKGLLYYDEATNEMKLRKYRADGSYSEVRLGDNSFTLNGNPVMISGFDNDVKGRSLNNVYRLTGRHMGTELLSDYGNGNVALSAQGGRLHIGYSNTTDVVVGTNASHKVWHAGNDGAGSGLDADLIDGREIFVQSGTPGGKNGDIWIQT